MAPLGIDVRPHIVLLDIVRLSDMAHKIADQHSVVLDRAIQPVHVANHFAVVFVHEHERVIYLNVFDHLQHPV